jgi:hypothetical protein
VDLLANLFLPSNRLLSAKHLNFLGLVAALVRELERLVVDLAAAVVAVLAVDFVAALEGQ